ncbi:hypothetical protein BpHYR1_014861 [Brachionus plicatilis]|uniref:Uncharacterized protein n=1 Tax=Brachionus plicatilis TaxID=10195 RepID=A0A3M7Q7H8_BRAPC|nr:hypothetical protein BpHYR1_014861 [Brachionus plicatilis]
MTLSVIKMDFETFSNDSEISFNNTEHKSYAAFKLLRSLKKFILFTKTPVQIDHTRFLLFTK